MASNVTACIDSEGHDETHGFPRINHLIHASVGLLSRVRVPIWLIPAAAVADSGGPIQPCPPHQSWEEWSLPPLVSEVLDPL